MKSDRNDVLLPITSRSTSEWTIFLPPFVAERHFMQIVHTISLTHGTTNAIPIKIYRQKRHIFRCHAGVIIFGCIERGLTEPRVLLLLFLFGFVTFLFVLFCWRSVVTLVFVFFLRPFMKSRVSLRFPDYWLSFIFGALPNACDSDASSTDPHYFPAKQGMEICMKATNTARQHSKLAREMRTTHKKCDRSGSRTEENQPATIVEAFQSSKHVHSYARLAVAIGHRSLSEICHSENGIYARRCSQSCARLDFIEDFDCARCLPQNGLLRNEYTQRCQQIRCNKQNNKYIVYGGRESGTKCGR